MATLVGTAGFVDIGSTAGQWRRSASFKMYAGRTEGKATYVRGDIRRGLMNKLSSRKGSKLDASLGGTIASTSYATARPSDVSSGMQIRAQTLDGGTQTESVNFDIVEAIVVEPASVNVELASEPVSVNVEPASEPVSVNVEPASEPISVNCEPVSEPLGVDAVVPREKRVRADSMDSLRASMEGLISTFQDSNDVEEVEEAEGTAETIAVLDEGEELRRKQTVKLLFYSTAAHSFALQLVMPANQSIWLQYFDGDFAAQAANASNLTSAALSAGIFINPIIAGASDVIGRKPILMGGLAISALGKIICAVRPGTSTLRVQTVLITPLAMAHALGVQTSLADLFAGDGKAFGAAQAQMLLATTMPGLVCPLIGASLTQKFGPSAPFALAGLTELGGFLMDSTSLKETQPPEEKKPFVLQDALKSANPLAFVELFRHGPRLAILAVMRLLNFACDKTNIMQVAEVHRNQVLGLTLQQNALYMVSAFCVAAPGFAVAGKMLSRFGTSTCLQVGMSMRTAESLIMSKATSLSVFRAILPLGIGGASAATSVAAMLQDEADRMKLNQGLFQGCLSSLNTITQVAMTLLWARLYAFGARRGVPGMYLQVIAMACLLQILLERTLSKMGDRAATTAVHAK